jgi:hypothetical protein
MNRPPLRLIVLATLALSAGCYRLTVITGAPPSNKEIQIPWQNSWVFGFVAPEEISTKEFCPLGIAKYEVDQSFGNTVASKVTFNIYTPIRVTIACAAGPVAR